MRNVKFLAASVAISVMALASHAEAQAFTFTNANPSIAVTASAAGPAAACTWGAAATAAVGALGNFQKAGDTVAAAKGIAVNQPFTCTGANATVTVTASSANGGKLQSGTTGAYWTLAYEVYPGSTTATGTPLTLTTTGVAFPGTIAATNGVATNATFYVNVKAGTALQAVGAPANIATGATVNFTDTITLSATYN